MPIILGQQRLREFQRQVLPRRTRKTIHTLSSAGSNCACIYVSGHLEQAQHLALDAGLACYLRLIDTPEKLQPIVARFRNAGVEVCLRLCVVPGDA